MKNVFAYRFLSIFIMLCLFSFFSPNVGDIAEAYSIIWKDMPTSIWASAEVNENTVSSEATKEQWFEFHLIRYNEDPTSPTSIPVAFEFIFKVENSDRLDSRLGSEHPRVSSLEGRVEHGTTLSDLDVDIEEDRINVPDEINEDKDIVFTLDLFPGESYLLGWSVYVKTSREGISDYGTLGAGFIFNGATINPGQPVPEPSTMLLLGSGLIGLAGYGRKRFFKK